MFMIIRILNITSFFSFLSSFPGVVPVFYVFHLDEFKKWVRFRRYWLKCGSFQCD